ncbi:MAG: hypothetical protein WAU86_19155 [Oricola sp.]
MSVLLSIYVKDIKIGEDDFHLSGFSGRGAGGLRRKIKRLGRVSVFYKLTHSSFDIGAILGKYFASRTLRRLGFELRIFPAIK